MALPEKTLTPRLFLFRNFGRKDVPSDSYSVKGTTMKTQTNQTNEDLLRAIIAALKKRGTRCGTGAEMNMIRAGRK
jgi:hypothetical protein